MIFMQGCKEKIKSTGAEYPHDFPEECVIAYDKWRDKLDVMEASKRLKRWQEDIDRGRISRKAQIIGFAKSDKNEAFLNKFRDNCKIMNPMHEFYIKKARRADSMTYEEFKEAYGGATKEDLDAIFAR